MRVSCRCPRLPSAARHRRAPPRFPSCTARLSLACTPQEGPSSVLFTAGSQPLGQCLAQVCRTEGGSQDKEGCIPWEAPRTAPAGPNGVSGRLRKAAGSERKGGVTQGGQGGQREHLDPDLSDLGARAVPRTERSGVCRRLRSWGGPGGPQGSADPGIGDPPPTPSIVNGSPGVQ